MSTPGGRRGARRILVRIETAPSGRVALQTAAEIAARLDAELVGLFVEDADLYSLARLPFAHEIGLASGTRRALNLEAMQRQLGALAEQARRTMEEIASRGPLRWTFRTARGSMHAELAAAAGEADLVITRAAGVEWSALKFTERPPVFVLQDGDSSRLTLVTLCEPAPDPAGLAATVAALARGARSAVDLIGLAAGPEQARAWMAELREELDRQGCEQEVRMRCADIAEALVAMLRALRPRPGASK
ncbi:MAG: hypothetical protein IT514_09390 [Burkholderiales bacterium]|nr:hypothetical protein [Burkholderiales bacterium]